MRKARMEGGKFGAGIKRLRVQRLSKSIPRVSGVKQPRVKLRGVPAIVPSLRLLRRTHPSEPCP